MKTKTHSDDDLRNAVVSALAANEQTAGLDLRVGVLNGVAHLGGSAPSLELWKMAQQITKQTPGVRGVANRIEAPGAPAPGRIIHLDFLDREKPEG
jgi:osmotically-inducible protein OsmY